MATKVPIITPFAPAVLQPGGVVQASPEPPPAQAFGGLIDHNQYLKLIYDPTNKGIKIVSAGLPSGFNGTILDAESAWKSAFDGTTVALRITRVATVGSPVSILDFNQIVKDVYDPAILAFRVTTPPVRATNPTMLDAAQVFQYVHVPKSHALAVDDVLAASAHLGTTMDGPQIIQAILNPATGRLRVVS